MFKRIHERLDVFINRIRELDHEVERLRLSVEARGVEGQRRLESIETWMELAVDTKADEIAERFDVLLREHNGKVTNQVLKDLVRQAAKGR